MHKLYDLNNLIKNVIEISKDKTAEECDARNVEQRIKSRVQNPSLINNKSKILLLSFNKLSSHPDSKL